MFSNTVQELQKKVQIYFQPVFEVFNLIFSALFSSEEQNRIEYFSATLEHQKKSHLLINSTVERSST
jgi:hypothetical protein